MWFLLGIPLGYSEMAWLQINDLAGLCELANDVQMSSTTVVLCVFIESENAFANRGMTEKLFLDPASGNKPTCDAMPRHHDAEPPCIEMKIRNIGSSRQRVMDDHQRTLKAFKAVAGFNENARQPCR